MAQLRVSLNQEPTGSAGGEVLVLLPLLLLPLLLPKMMVDATSFVQKQDFFGEATASAISLREQLDQKPPFPPISAAMTQ